MSEWERECLNHWGTDRLANDLARQQRDPGIGEGLLRLMEEIHDAVLSSMLVMGSQKPTALDHLNAGQIRVACVGA